MGRLISAMLILSIVNSVPIFGQITRGQLSGVATDQTGAAIPGASVTVKSIATGEAAQTMTDPQGNFVLPPLPVGRYTVTVAAAGFQRVEVPDVVIEVSLPAKVIVSLPIGTLAQEVSVK